MKSFIRNFTAGIFSFVWVLPVAGQADNPQKEAIRTVFKKYIEIGLPGLSLTVYDPKFGFWTYNEGYAELKVSPMQEDHIQYLQSVSKTYMAVAILKLREEGRIDLDAPIHRYVDYPWLRAIKGSEKVSIKMLLNHNSGLPEYSTHPKLISKIIQDPLKVLGVEEMLSVIREEPMDFEAGSKYSYRNTNYALLSLIADKITGDHVTFIESEILAKLKLEHTYYLTRDNYQADIKLVASYWDVLMEGRPADISGLQRANVASMKGDDGLVASSRDAVLFLKGLMEGHLLKPESLQLMQDWITDEEGKPRYGMGLVYYDLGEFHGVGHSGGGIGAGCVLLHIPEKGITLFLATNFNTMMESPLRKKAEALQTDVLMALLTE